MRHPGRRDSDGKNSRIGCVRPKWFRGGSESAPNCISDRPSNQWRTADAKCKSCECRTIQLGSCRPVACKAVSGGAIVTLVESWEPTELGVLERAAKVRSFALDAAWSEAAVSSHYASSQSLALREGGSLRAVSVGLRRSKAGFSKVVCGTNGGVGIVADEPH